MTRTGSRVDVIARLELLAEAGALLGAALDYEEVLQKIARLMVGGPADWCSVDVLDPDGSLRRVSLAHADPAKADLVQQLDRYLPRSETNPVWGVIRDAAPLLLPDVTEEILRAAAVDQDHLALLRALGIRSAIVVPLLARGRVLGIISLASEAGKYGNDDLTFAQELASRAALALDNARLLRDSREAEQRFRDLVGTVDAIVWEADPASGRLTFVSDASERILGYPPDRWVKEDGWDRLVHEDDRSRVRAALRAGVSDGLDIEFRTVAANGSMLWLRVTGHVVHAADGVTAHLRGLMQDVTGRVTALQQHAAQLAVTQVFAEVGTSEEIPARVLSGILDALGWEVGAVWEVTPDGDALHCVAFQRARGFECPSFEDMTRGYVFRSGVGLPGRVLATKRPAWIEDVTRDANFPRAPRAAAEGLHGAFGFPVLTGGRVAGVLEFFSRQIRVPDEGLLRLMGSIGVQVGQFMERRDAEAAVLASEARSRAVMDASLDAMICMDAQGRVIRVNPAAEQTFGFTGAEVVGAPLAELIIPPDLRARHREALARFVATGQPTILDRRIELTALRSDGSVFPVELTVIRVGNDDPPVFTGFIRDLSDRVQSDRRRRAQYDVARVLATSETIEQAVPQILAAVGEQLGWQLGALWLVDRATARLTCAEIWRAPGTVVPEFERASRAITFSRGEGLPGRIWLEREPIWVSDIARYPAYRRASTAAEAGLHACFGFPVVGGEDVFGVVEFFSRDTREPDLDLLRTMAVLGQQLGVFIERVVAEGEVRFQKTMLESQSETTIDGVVVSSPEGEILSMNRRFTEMFGLTPEIADRLDAEETLREVTRRVADPEPFHQRLVELWSNRDERAREEILLADGRIFDRYTAPLRAQDGTYYGRAWYYRDISDAKRAERALADSAARMTFLAEASALLASAPDDLDGTLEQLGGMAVPALADWAVIDLLQPDGSLRRVSVSHRDPAKAAWARSASFRESMLPDGALGRGTPRVLATGRAEMESEIADAWLVEAAHGDEDALALMRSLSLVSYLCVPLAARGRTLGALTFVTTAESGRRYGPHDMEFAEQLAARAGLAIDNALLYRERSSVARTLQESLLPPHLPEIPGVDLAARYHPAGEGAEVGGDFYDLFPTGRDDWALVMGDVCGKGAEAAAVTALARYTIRAAAMQTRKPSRVLATLNEAILRQRGDDRFCTVAYARLRRAPRGYRLTVCSGGHPLPLVVSREGRVRQIGRAGTLLGVLPEPELHDKVVALMPGDLVVLYTDGVTEARRSDGETLGERTLRGLAGALAGISAREAVERIEAAALGVGGGHARDDIAILALRIPDELDQD